ncbi:MAG TPA: TetR/AcrR family transcriptional regulator [Solimonas sp.]|nr:TetR/AcrR family transcriptional regulator [Solimonas sp.]
MQRRKRNPDGTRTAILEAAGKILAKDGPEGLSVSQVAQLAGVNRGTAYQHFPTREQLLEATTSWVSDRLRSAVFGDEPPTDDVSQIDPQNVAERMVEFAMENPELGRVWLFEVLSSNRPASDPFWNQYRSQFEKFALTDMAQPGIDVEVHAVIMLIGTFLWPVFARSHARTAKERQQLAKRYSNEMLRLSLHGTMRPEKFPELDAKVGKALNVRKRSK